MPSYPFIVLTFFFFFYHVHTLRKKTTHNENVVVRLALWLGRVAETAAWGNGKIGSWSLQYTLQCVHLGDVLGLSELLSSPAICI